MLLAAPSVHAEMRHLSSIHERAPLLAGSTGLLLLSQITAGVADGSIDIIVGTHALISESVQFSSLGLAIVDEQHR